MKNWRKTAGLILFVIGTRMAGANPEIAPISMGFYLPSIRDANMADVKVSLQAWAEEMARPYGLKIVTKTYDDMPSMREAMDRGDLHFINSSGMELAEHFSPDELKEGYVRRLRGADEGLVLIVNKASAFHKFSELRGKRLARLSKDRLSEIFLETQCLKTARQDCREYLLLTDEKRDIQSVYKVFFGQADAALVALSTLRTASDLNPQIAERLTVILDWKLPGLTFGMMTRHADSGSRSQVLRSADEAIKSSRGRQMLELFKTDYLESVDADALKPFRALLREYGDLRKSAGTKKK